MRVRAAIVLLLCFLLPGAAVLSGGNPWLDRRDGNGPVQIDGQRFEGVPSDAGNDSIRRRALEFVRRGGKLARLVPAPGARRVPSLPGGFREKHGLRFDSRGISNEIRTGTVSGSVTKGRFPVSEGWEYIESKTGNHFALAINHQGGRKSIVLIDRARNAFLSISN